VLARLVQFYLIYFRMTHFQEWKPCTKTASFRLSKKVLSILHFRVLAAESGFGLQIAYQSVVVFVTHHTHCTPSAPVPACGSIAAPCEVPVSKTKQNKTIVITIKKEGEFIARHAKNNLSSKSFSGGACPRSLQGHLVEWCTTNTALHKGSCIPGSGQQWHKAARYLFYDVSF